VVKDGQPLLLRAYGSATLDHLLELGRLLEAPPSMGVFRFGPREQLQLFAGPAAGYIPGLGSWLDLAGQLCQSAADRASRGWAFQPNDELLMRILDKASGHDVDDASLDSLQRQLGPLFDGRHGAGLVTGAYFGHRRAKRGGALPGSPDSLIDIYPDDHLRIGLLTRSVGASADVALRHLADALAANVFMQSPAADDPYDNQLAGTYGGQSASGAFEFLVVNSQQTPLIVSVDGQPQMHLGLVLPAR
jgi:hypothetical protein